MKFESGPYFNFDGSNNSLSHLSDIVTSFYFQNFTLHNFGNSETEHATLNFFTIYQNYELSRGHSAERVYGQARADMDTMTGDLMIKTPKTNGQYKQCKVVGLARRNWAEFDGHTGFHEIFIGWDQTIIKKPFQYVTDMRFWELNWPVAMHYNFHVDPNCEVNFSVKDRLRFEEALDGYLIQSMRRLIVRHFEEQYTNNYILPYVKYIESKSNW